MFVNDIVNAELNLNLNTYRGFKPATNIEAEGLASRSWGKTINVRRDADGYFQGIYIGAGPYFSVKTLANFDEELANLLGSPTDVFVPNTTFLVTDTTTEQLALAVTGGYRARLPLANRASARDGVYVAANYHYLHGFAYNDVALDVQFDTNALGLVTILPTTQPIEIGRLHSTSGRGFAIDLGVDIVADRWEVGFGVNGIANRITWDDVELQSFVLRSLVTGGDFVETTFPGFVEPRRIELPVDYTANVGYSSDTWSAVSQVLARIPGRYLSRRGGVPVRGRRSARRRALFTGPVASHRGSGVQFHAAGQSRRRLVRDEHQLERRRHPALALSLRFNR